MSELAASSVSPPGGLAAALTPFGAVPAGPATPARAAPASRPDDAALAALPTIREEDIPKCVNCKTCYQQASEIFEKTTIVEDGVAKEVARVIPGALARIKITPELASRVARVAANCDSEIIH
jgi:pyruvate-ferredoxin/flavodoxin oxidoreductase